MHDFLRPPQPLTEWPPCDPADSPSQLSLLIEDWSTPAQPVAATEASSPEVVISGRSLRPTPVFDTYWRFAAERQAIYAARVAGEPGPWTHDPVLRKFRFTCPYRAADRVSQYLIRHVIYTGPQDPAEIVFRTLLFKFFNRISTWELHTRALGAPTWSRFNLDVYDRLFTDAQYHDVRLYSAAYVIPPPAMGAPRKHTNHLRLLWQMTTELPERLAATRSLREVYELLLGYPSLGPFLAYQLTIDLNYSTIVNFDENEFVVAGPGARDGIRKVFGPGADGIEADVIRYMAEHQDEHFARLGLTFPKLGSRDLALIDCQNLFYEVDKYARVTHPDITGHSGRTRIKQTYTPLPHPVPAWFPPKWDMNGD